MGLEDITVTLMHTLKDYTSVQSIGVRERWGNVYPPATYIVSYWRLNTLLIMNCLPLGAQLSLIKSCFMLIKFNSKTNLSVYQIPGMENHEYIITIHKTAT